MTKKEMKEIADKVMSKIETNKIKIKTKSQIILEEAIFGLLFIIFILNTMFILNIVMFFINQSQIPIVQTTIALISLITTINLIKHYDFSYRTPFTLFIVIVLIVIGAVSIYRSHINMYLYHHKTFHKIYRSPQIYMRHHKYYKMK